MKLNLLSFLKNAGHPTAAAAAAQKTTLAKADAVFESAPVSHPKPLVATAPQPAAAPQPATAPPEKPMSSLFAKIEGAEKSTAAWIEKRLEEIEGEAPAIGKVIDASLTYITPVLQIALGATGDPAAAAVVGKVAAQAETDLSVASALVSDFGPTPTAATAFASVKTNLSALLTAGHVTSTTAVAAVTKAVNEVGVLATAVQVAAAGITTAATAKAA
jgi:hypothetical protein